MSYYPKSNQNFSNSWSKPKSSGLKPLPLPAGNYGGKSEAELLKEIQTICQLFPKGDKLRDAAEKQARRVIRP